MTTIYTLNEKDLWKDAFNKLPSEQQDIYFTPEYYSIYEANGDGEARCFVYQSQNQIALYPFLLNSINRLGYDLNNEFYDIQGAYGYNGPSSSSNNNEFIAAFWNEFDNYCNTNNIVAEFTRFHPLLQNYNLTKNHFQTFLDRETVCLDLTLPYNEIWEKQYSTKNRNIIRKSITNGNYCEILTNPTDEEINAFVRTYEHSMIAVSADDYYFFNKNYYKQIFKSLIGNLYLVLIRNKEHEISCASLFFHCGKYFHYHLSGRSEHADQTVNNYLLDQAVQLAQKVGATKFHFGGGSTRNADDGLLLFKSRFSKDRTPFHIGKKIHNPSIYQNILYQWKKIHPDSFQKNSHLLLGYRNI